MTIDSGRFPVPPALVEHARRFNAGTATPAAPRVAATVLLLRPAAAGTGPGTGFEVYVIRRLASMAFGGMYAFPGGGVDPSDSTVTIDWSGPSRERWGARLGLPPAAAQAVVCAAAREVFEEAGVLLAGPAAAGGLAGGASGSLAGGASGGLAGGASEGPVDDALGGVVDDVSGADWEAARLALVQRRLSFAELLRERGLAIRSDLLLPWARWITPEFEPRRFDTYFFLALLPGGQRTRDVSGEADHTMWITPADALSRAGAGELAMLPPTLVTLGQVAACADLPAALAAAAERDVVHPVMPRLETAADGTAHFVIAPEDGLDR